MTKRDDDYETEKRLTVVVTVYNVKDYLKDCLDSIVNQTIRPFELIIVDDGSNDGSEVICDEYERDFSFITVIHQTNRGVSKARLIGYENAKTEYLIYIDADDFIDNSLIEKATCWLNKKIDVITFGITRYYNKSYTQNSSFEIQPGVYDKNRLEQQVYPIMLWDSQKHICGLDASLCNKIIKKSLYSGYIQEVSNLGIHYGEDVALIYLTLLRSKSMVVLNEWLYYHRQRGKGQLAEYILDDEYIDKLHTLYCYLKEKLPGSKMMTKQLEYFYLHALEVRLRVYGDYKSRRLHVFPFDKVPPHKNVVLHGAGEIGQNYFEQISKISYCKELMWADQNYKKLTEYGVINPNSLNDFSNIDYVVIAVISENAAMDIRKKYMTKGVSPEKIIWG